MRTLLLVSVSLALACGDDDGSVEDAGPADAAVDAFVPTRDLGPACELSCDAFESCCVVEGSPTCVDTRTDPNNCGLCGLVCSEGRGTTCEGGFCRCGAARLGCVGQEESLCCPPAGERTREYCANLRQDFRDCGACGDECDIAVGDRCGAGRCVCGESRTGCDGTDESTCCTDTLGTVVECRNLTIDRFHCGACGNRCQLSESCANGSCTVGPTICEERCTDGRICCGGACCTRAACLDGVCGGADAGVGDAGVGDAGVGDGGA